MDEAAAKATMRRIPYGLYVCTTKTADDGHHAFILSWATQVSFKPRLIAIGVNTEGRAHGHIERSKRFCVNLLPHDAKPTVMEFLKSHEAPKGGTAFDDHPFKPGEATGAAVLDAALGWIECKVHSVLQVGGDHELIVGEVVGAGHREDGEIATHAGLGLHYAG